MGLGAVVSASDRPLYAERVGAIPEVRFVRSGEADIAYQVFGDGPLDIVLIPGWVSHCELAWELPEMARFLERFAEMGRVLTLDKRGVGMSDRMISSTALEDWMEDLRVVLDEVGWERAAMVGWTDSAAMLAMFAATYPDRVTALALGAVTARGRGDSDSDVSGFDPIVMDQLAESIGSTWGQAGFLNMVAPSVVSDARFTAWFRRYERFSATPKTAEALLRVMLEIDVRAVLPTVQVPTLVINRRDTFMGTELGRWFAAQIPDARYVELPGADILPYVGDTGAILDEIEEFLTGASARARGDRVLATVLFTDIVGSTEHAEAHGDQGWQDLLEAYRSEVRRLLDRFEGREIDTAGDGFLATFEGPARAVKCALASCDAVRDLGMEIRAGLHTGEVELRGGSVSGLAVHIGARVADLAASGEVLVTSTVKDLVVGSGLLFADRGRHSLKGVADDWQLFAATA